MKILAILLFFLVPCHCFSQIRQFRAVQSCYKEVKDGKVAGGCPFVKNESLIVLNLNMRTIKIYNEKETTFSILSSLPLPSDKFQDGQNSGTIYTTLDANGDKCPIEIDIYDHQGKGGGNISIWLYGTNWLLIYMANPVQ